MRKVCPSAVVAPISCTRRVATCSASSKSAALVAVVHEHHVDVGRVRELAAAEASHADDGKG